MRLHSKILEWLYQIWKCDKRVKIYAYSFAFLYSGSVVLGKALYDTNNIDTFLTPFPHLARELLAVLGLTLIVEFLLCAVFQYLIRMDVVETRKHGARTYKKYFREWICTPLLFVLWFPAYLAYYPGILSYDMWGQTYQALGNLSDISKFHPPLHTFFWKGCLYLGNFIGVEPIIIYSVIQMTLMAWACSRLLCLMARKNCNLWLVVGSTMFLGLNPVIAICSFIPAKDMCFAIFFLLLGVEICEFLNNKNAYFYSVHKVVRFAVIVILCCLFRNNAVYAMVLCIPFAVGLLDHFRIRWTLVLMISILCFLGINGPFYDSLGIQDGSPAEMLSVPIQQIAYVAYSEEKLSSEEIKEINTYIPYDMIRDAYNPRFADPIKNHFNTEQFKTDKGRFIRLWWNLFRKYPGDYVNAFLTLNLPYWYPKASAVDAYSQREYVETRIVDAEYTFERDSKLPGLYTLYEKVASYELFAHVPVLSRLFALSTVVWVLLAGIWILLLKRRREAVLVFLPSLLLWLTFMAGPVSNFRYIFPIYIQYPLFVAMAFQTDRMLKCI